MFSCNSLYTRNLECIGINKIEMYLQDKPLCATWNAGAEKGLVDATSTNLDIVNDPVQFLDKFSSKPTATNEGWEFVPNGVNLTT